MRFKSIPKILVVTEPVAGKALADGLQQSSGAEAVVYTVVPKGDDLMLIRAEGGPDGPDAEDLPLVNPLTGGTLVVAPDAAEDDPLLERIASIWTDANLPAPHRITQRDGSADEALRLLLGMARTTTREMAEQNVDLLNQIATLRLLSEDLSMENTSLRDLVAFKNADFHHQLYELRALQDRFTLNPGESIRQRLPITVIPSLVGAVSFTAWSLVQGALKLRVHAIETAACLQETGIDLVPGRNQVFVRFEQAFTPTMKLIDLEFEVTGSAPIELRMAQQESPEEQVRRDGTFLDEPVWAGSIYLNIWSEGPRRTKVTPGVPRRRVVPAWDLWRNSAQRCTPGFASRNWLHKIGHNGLLVHPITAAYSVAQCRIAQKHAGVVGVVFRVSLPASSSSPVDFRTVFTPGEVGVFKDQTACDDYAEQDLAGNEVWRSAWSTLEPGESRMLTIEWDAPQLEGYMVMIASVGASSDQGCHFTVSDLKLIEVAEL